MPCRIQSRKIRFDECIANNCGFFIRGPGCKENIMGNLFQS